MKQTKEEQSKTKKVVAQLDSCNLFAGALKIESTNQMSRISLFARIVTNISVSFDEHYVTNNIRAMHASTGFVGLSDVVLPLFTED